MRRRKATDGNKGGLSDDDSTEDSTKASCGRHLAFAKRASCIVVTTCIQLLTQSFSLSASRT